MVAVGLCHEVPRLIHKKTPELYWTRGLSVAAFGRDFAARAPFHFSGIIFAPFDLNPSSSRPSRRVSRGFAGLRPPWCDFSTSSALGRPQAL